MLTGFFVVQAHVGLEYKRALQVCSGALATAAFSHHLTRLLSPPHHVSSRCGYSLASLGSRLYYFYASTTSLPLLLLCLRLQDLVKIENKKL